MTRSPNTASNDLPRREVLHHHASSAALVFFLKFFFAIWFFRYLLDPLQNLSQLPIEYSDPVGWLRWLNVNFYVALHSFTALLLIKFGILAACVGVWFPKTRIKSAILGCILVANACAISRGFGHLNHAEISPLLVTCILTFFAWRLPTANLQHPDHKPNQTAATGLILATLVLALSYALAGVERMAVGGFELFTGDTMVNYAVQRSFSTWVFEFNFSQLLLANPWLAAMLKIGTVVVTIAEIAMPFCLVSRRMRFFILLVMPAFHIGAILMFKVVFIELPLSLLLLWNVSPWLAARSQKRNMANSRAQTATA